MPGKASNNPIVYGLAVMVLIAGMRSMLDLIIMSYALVAWWGVNRLLSRLAIGRLLKILHVVASYLPAVRYGGTIVSVHGLCRALARRGHDVHVFTTSVDGPGDSAVPHNTAVDDGRRQGLVFPVAAGAPAVFRAAARRHASQSRARVRRRPHARDLFVAAVDRRAVPPTRRGVPYVVSPRGMLEKELIESKSRLWKAALIGFFEKRTLEDAAAIHVTSRREADEARAFGFDLPPMCEIPNGVDIESDATGTGVAGDRRDHVARAVRAVPRPHQLEEGPRSTDPRPCARAAGQGRHRRQR